MNRSATTFLTVSVMTGLLTALSLALRIKGYPFGSVGEARLDSLASAASFIPLAALYALSVALLMLLPLRAAAFVLVTAAAPFHTAAVVLLAGILGIQLARLGFGNSKALTEFLDWRFLFAAAIIGVHLVLDVLRRNVLIRSLSFVVFLAATLACLYWNFRL